MLSVMFCGKLSTNFVVLRQILKKKNAVNYGKFKPNKWQKPQTIAISFIPPAARKFSSYIWPGRKKKRNARCLAGNPADLAGEN